MSEIKNATFGYRAEFDRDSKQSTIVLMGKSESGGESVELVYDDPAALELATRMSGDALLALQVLQAHGFEEGIEILGMVTEDEYRENPMTIDDMFGDDKE